MLFWLLIEQKEIRVNGCSFYKFTVFPDKFSNLLADGRKRFTRCAQLRGLSTMGVVCRDDTKGERFYGYQLILTPSDK
jgi:hypothetical protein